jgi:hypothetical protein
MQFTNFTKLPPLGTTDDELDGDVVVPRLATDGVFAAPQAARAATSAPTATMRTSVISPKQRPVL